MKKPTSERRGLPPPWFAPIGPCPLVRAGWALPPGPHRLGLAPALVRAGWGLPPPWYIIV